MRSAHAHWDDSPVRPTVLIVDDHAEFRQSAGALLEAEGFAVIAEAADGDEAIAAVERVAAADRAARHAASRAGRLRRGRAVGGGAAIRPWSCSSRAARRRPTARDSRRPPRAGSSRSASSRARRSPRSSADRVDAVVPAAPLAGGRLLGIAAEWVSFGWGDPRHWVPDLVTGWTLIACGLVAWSRRPDSRSGPLLAATGFSWFFGNFAARRALAIYVYRGPLVHLLVTYPERAALLAPRGRRGRRRLRRGRGRRRSGGARSSRSSSPSFWSPSALARTRGRSAPRAGRACVALWAAARPRARARRGCGGSPGRARRGRERPVASRARGDALRPRRRAPRGAPLALLGATARSPTSSIELGESRAGTLRDELARALGDPTLEVGYWLPSRRCLRRLRGPPARASRPGLRALGHDRSRVKGGRSRHSSTTRPCSTIRACARRSRPRPGSPPRTRASPRRCAPRWRSSEESRRRILEAGDEERRRLERRLRGGAQAAAGAARGAAARRSGSPPPPRPRGSASPGPRLSSSARWRSSAGSRTASIRESSPRRGSPARSRRSQSRLR